MPPLAWYFEFEPRHGAVSNVQKLILTTAMTALTQSDAARDTAQSIATTAAAIGAGVATRSLITKVWEQATGEAPPNDPTDPGVSWQQALTWAAAAGVGVGVGRVVGRRLAAGAFEKSNQKPATTEA